MGTLRLFVAIYPPADVAESLLRHAAQVPAARPIPAAQVHLTLHFVGEVDHRESDNVRTSVRRSAAGLSRFALTAESVAVLPERGPARLIAAVTDSPPQLAEIHRRLVTRLARPGRARRELFLPHLTLARFPGAGVHRPQGLPVAIAPIGFDVREIVLLRSVLTPEHAVHEPVEVVPLDADVRRDPPPEPE